MSERLIEQTSGLGQVFAGQKFLTDARYEIEVYERYEDVTNVGQHANVKVGGRVELRILSMSVPIHVDSRDRLTLHLESGRKLDFYWLRPTATATEGLY